MNRKKICSLILAGILMAGLTACQNEKEAEATEENSLQDQAETMEEVTLSEPKDEIDLEEDVEDTEAVQEISEERDTIDNEGMKDQYMSILLDIWTKNRLPDGSALDSLAEFEEMSDNKFSVCDIDGDGKRELIIQYVTASSAGMMELIYDYDGGTKSVRKQFVEYPALTYYDNGMIEAGWSHNQGLAGDALWPYTLFQYDPEEDAWHVVASVDAWSRERSETNWSDNSGFPEKTDADGDGVVYYIWPEGVYEGIDPVDGTEYEQWRDSYLGDANVLDIVYEEMTEQNIYMLE